MKIIFSRKYFDSQYGGYPSPIMPDASLCPLPIPQRKGTPGPQSFESLSYGDDNIGRIVSVLTEGQVEADRTVHLDPDLREDTMPRMPGWRPLFGQVGRAQSHLHKHEVGHGDVFLFFGWFRQAIFTDGKLAYDGEARDLHVIFGWLQVEQFFKPTALKTGIPEWAHYHPHVASANRRESNNTVYMALERLELPRLAQTIPGGGMFRSFAPEIRLTAEDSSRSVWHLPGWFYPEEGKPLVDDNLHFLGKCNRLPPNTLRGSMDDAEYRHVALGLVSLKHSSGAFEVITPFPLSTCTSGPTWRTSAMAREKKEQETRRVDRIADSISRLAARLVDIHRNAKALGIFTNDRELLQCPQCGLAEDVTCDGLLITVQSDNGPTVDTALRFQEIDATHFRCPNCNGVLCATEEEAADNGE